MFWRHPATVDLWLQANFRVGSGKGVFTFRLLTITAFLARLRSPRWRWPDGQKYKLLELTTGNVVQTVSANGTLNPVVLISVGTQVSGTVKKLYVDFNDKVKKGIEA